MGVFSYKVVSGAAAVATTVEGTIVADTPRNARDTLRARGLTILEVVPLERAARMPVWLTWGRRRHVTKSVSFIRELSTLLGVGIPILEAIDTIANQHRGSFRASLLMLRDRVSEGLSLAEAMRQLPGEGQASTVSEDGSPGGSGGSGGVFDDLAISITEVGEQAGTLDVALAQLADFKERSLQFQNRVASALLYPCVVLLMGVGVAVFLMTYVVPNLLATLIDSGQPLPMSTQIVKGISDALVDYWWLLGGLVLALAAAVSGTLRTRRGRRAWHRMQLKIPLVGDLLRKQTIARVAVVVSTLMKSGIVFVRAVQIAQRSTRNVVIREALAQCAQAVEGGRDIAQSLAATGAFPGVVVQIFSVGQQSGRLEEMLDRLAVDYDRQVAVATGRLTSLLEPLLIVLLAAIVGLIAFATILPILEAGNVL